MTFSLPQSKISVVMFGARRHYAVPRILHSGNLLEKFYTDITGIQGWPRVLSLIPKQFLAKPLQRLRGRVPKDIPLDKLVTFPFFGLQNYAKLAKCKSLEEKLLTYAWASDKLSYLILSKESIPQAITYTFDRSGLEIMQQTKSQGGMCIMEQTVAPFAIDQKILLEEYVRFPEWTSTIESLSDSSWLIDREQQEWELADLIICGSEYVRAGIKACGGPVEKCQVVPYGIDGRLARKSEIPVVHNSPLRVLTVGSVSLRKGAAYIAEVAKRLSKEAEFRFVGPINITAKARSLLEEHVELTEQVPRDQIAQHFAWADVFFLPSLNEGSAMVVYEALSAGLPVICTPNTGSVVRDGHNGYIVPVRDVDAMCEVIVSLADDRFKLNKLTANAILSNADYSFEGYRDRLLNCIYEFLR